MKTRLCTVVGLLFLPTILLPAIALPGRLSASGSEPKQIAAEFVDGSRSVRYWLYLPPEYDATENRETTFPMLLFLHGGGESGDDLEKVKKHGPPKMIEAGREFPMIVVSPQNPGETTLWDDVILERLLDDLEKTLRVDSSRIYLTGLSRGAFGTWRMAIQNPQRYAAIAPIAGGGLETYAFRLKSIPIWAFHGAKDTVVKSTESHRMVDAVNAAGGNAKLTIDPNAEHDSWTKAYSNEELWTWLLSNKLGE